MVQQAIPDATIVVAAPAGLIETPKSYDGTKTVVLMWQAIVASYRRRAITAIEGDSAALPRTEADAYALGVCDEDFTQREQNRLGLVSWQQDIVDRKRFGQRLYSLSAWWLAAVLLTLWSVHLSDNVAIALITSTTFNVLGLVYVVAHYLFPGSKQLPGVPKPQVPE